MPLVALILPSVSHTLFITIDWDIADVGRDRILAVSVYQIIELLTTVASNMYLFSSALSRYGLFDSKLE